MRSAGSTALPIDIPDFSMVFLKVSVSCCGLFLIIIEWL